MNIVLIIILFFVSGFSCLAFVLDSGLSICHNECKLQGKNFKNFGWDKSGKKFCECEAINE